jgi:hypothetical protein
LHPRNPPPRTLAERDAFNKANKLIRAASLQWLDLKPIHDDYDGPEPDV